MVFATSASGSPSARRLIWPAGPQVALHDGRRRHLHVGDVVEVRALGVERQIRGDVHTDAQQILDRRRILGAVQALERPGARLRIVGPRLVEARLEIDDDALEHLGLRAPHAGRWHHARAELADHALGDAGIVGAMGHGGCVESVEDEIAASARLAVTARTVFLDDFVGVFGVAGRHGRYRKVGQGRLGRVDTRLRRQAHHEQAGDE